MIFHLIFQWEYESALDRLYLLIGPKDKYRVFLHRLEIKLPLKTNLFDRIILDVFDFGLNTKYGTYLIVLPVFETYIPIILDMLLN